MSPLSTLDRSVRSLAVARRRYFPPSEEESLRQILDVHSEIISAGFDLHRLVGIITRRAEELTQSSGAVLEIIEGDELVYWSASGNLAPFMGLRVDRERSLSGLAAKSGQVLICDDCETDTRVDRATCRRIGLRSMLVAPLPYRGTNIGVLKVVSPWTKAYATHDVQTLQRLNTVFGAALAQAAAHGRLVEQARKGTEIESPSENTRRRVERMIAARDFRIAYQPILNLHESTIVGYEALARFSDGTAPDRWFQDAHTIGLGCELELAAAERAVDIFARRQSHAYLAINLSPTTLLRADVENVCAALDPKKIVVEMTEHANVEDYEVLNERVNNLRQLGIRIAIDDAGAGFASLRHVLRISPDFIKLDRSITHQVDSLAGHQSLTAALLTFAQGTSSTLVAEGIETEQEAAALRRLGVAFGQGYFLGVPEIAPD